MLTSTIFSNNPPSHAALLSVLYSVAAWSSHAGHEEVVLFTFV